MLNLLLLAIFLISCTHNQTVQSSSYSVGNEFSFAKPQVKILEQNGIVVLTVYSSIKKALYYPYDVKAVWIKTKLGLVSVVYFENSKIVKSIKISPLPEKEEGRYLY